MSAPKQIAIISRNYQPAPQHCAEALMLILKKSVNQKADKKSAPRPTGSGAA